MKYLPKPLLIFSMPCTLIIILLARPDVDNPFTYSHLGLTFLALIFLYGLIVTVAADLYRRVVKLEAAAKKDDLNSPS
ncbi:hypothetical protein [Shewanella kaireitica]|uniref:hypothetical protein n=1 Tax=Shewanella kaireitica TaxID=212021 RepID=UPI00200E0B7F|nr:hypothetical protein [Shewanella kaireitica]MCL1092885.1 hypothetical protein [Shewanella kaireitica]